MKQKELNYTNMTIQDIIDWCQENGQVEWLKDFASKTTPVLDDEGNPVLDKKGKPKVKKPSFFEIKIEFVNKFMSEIAPKSTKKKPNMYDLIDNL